MQKYFILTLFIAITAFAYGQDADHHPDRCSTVKYNEALYKANPALRAKHEALDMNIRQLLLQKNIQDTSQIVTIPVVVHVIWKTAAQNVSDTQIISQINVLNEDFRRHNADTIITPAMFDSVAADCRIEFCLAKRTPDSISTTGIERKQTTVTAFPMDNTMKSSTTGGLDAWDPHQYFNLWVCNLAGNVLGYAQYPGGTDSTDGVVIHYDNFGRVGNLDPHYKYGRTATHEIGHWLDLYHIWGDDFGSCDGTDYVDDTPNAKDANYYCPAQPRITICNSTGEMFQNYMDYTDDVCMNLYTKGQKARMWAAITLSRSTILTSKGCNPVIGIAENEWLQEIHIYPNPGNGIFNVTTRMNHPQPIRIRVTDMLGNIILQQDITADHANKMKFDLTREAEGVYFLQLISPAGSHSEKIIRSH